MSVRIHPTAIVDPKAELAGTIEVGPYAVIEAGVVIGDDTVVGPHCRLTGPTTVGRRNRLESHCSVGAPPQDMKYDGEPTRLEIGDDNSIREFVTLHRGTAGGQGFTRIGDRNLFMAYSHVAHDCNVGSHTVFANGATLAGHVDVADHATIGAYTAVHQFCRVGEHAFLGGFTVATQDCLPFMRTVGGRPAKCYGPNSIGLERKGFSEERRKAIKSFWRFLYSPKYTTSEAIEKARTELAGQPDVQLMIEFIESSKRGVILARA